MSLRIEPNSISRLGVMRIAAFFILALSWSAAAQESGIVTIYAAGEWKKGTIAEAVSGITIKGDAPSIANLFDGKQKLAYITPGRFVSIQLPAGKHVLTASREFNYPDGKAPVELSVERGGHYFYRMRTTRKMTPLGQRLTARLEAVSCEVSRDEAASHKAISIDRVEKDKRSSLVDKDSFPNCK